MSEIREEQMQTRQHAHEAGLKFAEMCLDEKLSCRGCQPLEVGDELCNLEDFFKTCYNNARSSLLRSW